MEPNQLQDLFLGLLVACLGGLGWYIKSLKDQIDRTDYRLDNMFQTDHVHRAEWIEHGRVTDEMRDQILKNTMRLDVLERWHDRNQQDAD